MGNDQYLNLLETEWKDRYSKLDKETQAELDILNEYMNRGESEKYALMKIKRSYKHPEKGDLFAFRPRENIYFPGLVINAHINNGYGEDMYIVTLFKNRITELKAEAFIPDYNKLLLPPLMVSRLNWSRGVFCSIGHLNDIGTLPDYGFYKPMYVHKFWNEYGEKIDHKPEFFTLGTTTMSGIGYYVNRELIIDKSLLN